MICMPIYINHRLIIARWQYYIFGDAVRKSEVRVNEFVWYTGNPRKSAQGGITGLGGQNDKK